VRKHREERSRGAGPASTGALARGIAAALAAAALLGGCGGGGNSGGGGSTKAPPVAKPEDFPKAAGQTIAGLSKKYGSGGPVLAPSVSQLE